MIILNLNKINTFNEISENILQNYTSMNNFGYLKCPFCHSSNLIRWGHYDRNIIYFPDNNSPLKSKVLKISRVKCKSCGHTHALLPNIIIPYKQFSLEVVCRGLLAFISKETSKFCEKFNIDESILNYNYKQFKKYHFSRLKIMCPNINICDSINNILKIDELQTKYIKLYNRCFMQIKLGIIGIGSS